MSDKTYYILAAEDCAACHATGTVLGDGVDTPCPVCNGEKYVMEPVEVFPHWVRGEVMFKLAREKGLAQKP